MSLFALALCACGDDGAVAVDAAASGSLCVTGAQQTDPTLLASPALECPARICVHIQDAPTDRCTAPCEQPDDCAASPDSTCAGGFDCVAPISVGPFSCQRMCLCTDDIAGTQFPACP